MRYPKAMVTLKKWTVDELLAMDKAGLLNPEKRIELIDGEVYEMPIGENHADVVDKLTEVLVKQFSGKARVRVQNPIFLDQADLVQPDFALLDAAQDYRNHHPRPESVYLVIEVSDTTLAHDRGKKLGRYARVGIREVWIVNLNAGYTEVYRDPHGDEYLTKFVVQKGSSVAPLAFPGDAVTLL
ncbi:MAG: Uma2 family endonuclease [Meiothermus sp.]